MVNEQEITQRTPVGERLWNRNFLLLWQGQFVSSLGNVVYGIALGFWILAVTGSTALMGTLMAASSLPRVLISPFAGVIVDRSNRKNMIIWMDIIRGITVVGVAAMAYQGTLQIWMVFLAGIVLGVCGAFFDPAVTSTLPDIVSKSYIVKANSFFQMIHTGTGIMGNSIGGFIFQVLGAPFLFLFNGLSYLFSAFTELFIRVPPIRHEEAENNFMKDLKQGMSYVWTFKGIRYLISLAAVLNFFAHMGFVLVLPLFERSASLGPARYGIAMAMMAGGMLAGMVFTSAVNIAAARRFSVFMVSSVVSSICFTAFPLVSSFPLMITLMSLAGFTNAIINVFFMSVVQMTTPQAMRGKVFGLIGTVLQSLSPLAMALAGVLGDMLPVHLVISWCFFLNLVLFIPFGFIPSFRTFINFDPKTQSAESLYQTKP